MMRSISDFRKIVWNYYHASARNLAWRRTRNPYRILVSEIMLQQTQVSRVGPYYEKFIKQFPDFEALAHAKTEDVLQAWQGLGYNRRALSLQKLAKVVEEKYGGKLPRDRAILESLPGIGSYTAGAIRVFAFNESEIFIETNIRRAFIYFFFPRKKSVHDREIMPLIIRACPSERKRRREWYWALMDYGAMLGIVVKQNPNRRSAHYAKQAKFQGSDRELRGKLLRLLLAKRTISMIEILRIIPESKERLDAVIAKLGQEGFIGQHNDMISILK